MNQTADRPRVSVIVPVRNGGRLFERCLRSVLAQDYPRERLEILVVDNGSTDGSADVARRLGLSPLYEARPGAALARNRGLSEASGDIVAFTDADCEVEPSWLSRLVTALEDADAVTGRIEAFPGGNRFARSRGALHELYLRDCVRLDRENRLDRLDSANAAAWRRVIEDVGGFHPQVVYVEDRELAVRIVERGHRLKFAEAPLALHHYEERLLSSMHKAEGTGRMWAKFPDLVSAEVLDRHFADVVKLLATARGFASPRGRLHLGLRFSLHIAAAVARPGFENTLHHFRAAEGLAILRGIASAEGQTRVQTNT